MKQVVSAGALALFNWHYLHAKAREPRLGLERRNVRHYTLIFVGHKFVFWVLEPTLDDGGGWAGCVMKRLFGADCTDEYAIRELAHWINEIHRYSSSRHGPSCKRDITAILNIGECGYQMFTGSCHIGECILIETYLRRIIVLLVPRPATRLTMASSCLLYSLLTQ